MSFKTYGAVSFIAVSCPFVVVFVSFLRVFIYLRSFFVCFGLFVGASLSLCSHYTSLCSLVFIYLCSHFLSICRTFFCSCVVLGAVS